jgi:hypothetical protein
MGWIRIEDREPTEEQFGEEFLCCIKTPSGVRYAIVEWFNPFLEGEGHSSSNLKSEFLIEGHAYTEEVIAWKEFKRYDNLS